MGNLKLEKELNGRRARVKTTMRHFDERELQRHGRDLEIVTMQDFDLMTH